MIDARTLHVLSSRELFRPLLLLLAALCGQISAAETKAPRPNIVVLLADDLGWADVGWHGSEINSVRFLNSAAAIR